MAEKMQDDLKNALSYEAIVRTLFENYESIYDVDVETSAYQCYYESDSFSELKIASTGNDFFQALSFNIWKLIYPEDREYVGRMLSRENMLRSLQKERYYVFVYRLILDGRPVYHKIRATLEQIDGRLHFLIGVRDVDETIRQEKAHTEALAFMHQKEETHMEAILASAEGYLEVNLTQDIVLGRSPFFAASDGSSFVSFPDLGEPLRYSMFNHWMCTQLLADGAEKYARMSGREALIAAFARRERRTLVSFSLRRPDGGVLLCEEVFYLYQDKASQDIMAFCVVYDLTERQRKEKELRELENALQMSRIRNFTSQMQPHFLYNALGSIQEIVLDDPEYASALIGDFTVHLRSCIRAMASDSLFPFSQELANIRAYINIEKMRFGEKLRVFYDIPVADFAILPLSIQPLVENAIRHGIYQRGPQGGTVTVRSRELPEAWLVEVEDDGVGFDTAQLQAQKAAGKKDSTGLENLIFRLKKVMRASVAIHSVVGSGTKVTVSIPKGGDAD